MRHLSDILQADPTSRLKLRRWTKKGAILLQPNALAVRLGRVARFAHRAPESSAQGLILMYHRITDATSDPQLLCVTPVHFAQHLAVLSEHYRVLPLREFTARAQSGASMRGTAAITFDDGYADNLHEA